MLRATISLPEPVSPVIKTEAELGAAISTMRMTSCIGLEPPTRSPRRPVSRSWRCRTASWRVSRAFSRQRSSSARRTGAFIGFSMYQNAPDSIAATARSSLPLPVMMIEGTLRSSLPSCLSRSRPFMPGSSTSAMSGVGLKAAEFREGVFGAGNTKDVVAPFLQELLVAFARVVFVFDDRGRGLCVRYRCESRCLSLPPCGP